MNLAKSIAAVVIVSLFGSIGASQAAEKKSSTKAASGRYRLVQGKGYTVCEAFLKNLNAFPATEPPMVCEQKIHPTHPEFTKPQWEDMDVQKNLNIVYAAESKLWRFTRAGEQPMPYDQWLKKFQERIKSGEAKPRLRKSILTLNEKGPETLVAYEPVINECQKYGGVGGSGGHIFVIRSGTEVSLDRISGMSDRLSEALIHGKKTYFLHSGDDVERLKNDVKHVWYIDLDPIFPGASSEGEYVKDQRCTCHVDQLKKQ